MTLSFRLASLRACRILATVSCLVLVGSTGCAGDSGEGNDGTGGVVATGGDGASGATGGAFAGGASTGGGNTGGVSSGGTSTGGVATGGAFPSGGTSTGGTSSGGTEATGGGDTGGTGGGMMSAYCPAAEPCKILPLGDSITEDVTQPGGAWRIGFFSRAVGDGKNITFVGSRSNGPDTVAGQPFPKSHEGTSGITIGDLNDKTNSVGLGDAHIILLHIGTNDMYQDAAGAPAALRAYVEDIIEQAPDALLVVSSIIPFTNVQAYNATIEPLVDEKAQEGAHILFADQFGNFPNGELADGVHPTPEGYDVMGGVYYDIVKDFLP